MTHISKNELEILNCLPVNEGFSQSINSVVLNFFANQCLSYLNEVFKLACRNNLKIRILYLKLICPLGKK